MNPKNIFYAQSGGPTAVINNTACGVIEAAQQQACKIGKVLAGHNGIIGAIQEELIDTSLESSETIASLRCRPGAVFGSCRYKLKAPSEDPAVYQRLFEVFSAHNIGYFFIMVAGTLKILSIKLRK